MGVGVEVGVGLGILVNVGVKARGEAAIRVKVGEAVAILPGERTVGEAWIAITVGVLPSRRPPPIRKIPPPTMPKSRNMAARPPTIQAQAGIRRTDMPAADGTATFGAPVIALPEAVTDILRVEPFGGRGPDGTRPGAGCQVGTGSPNP